MLEKKGIQEKKITLAVTALALAAMMQGKMEVQAAEPPQVQQQVVPEGSGSVSDNDALPGNETAAGSVSDNSALETSNGQGAVGNDGQAPDSFLPDGTGIDGEGPEADAKETEAAETEGAAEPGAEGAEEALPPVQEVDSSQLQTLNYKSGILTDWQQINEALRGLSPDSLTNPDMDGKSLVLQLQNVSNIPADIKDSLASDGSGYTKYLHCNIGCGVSLVFSGAADNSGFAGMSNATVTGVDSEKRGKKSMAVTIKFASHENLGTAASLHINLPQCGKGTKVSVYAETVSMDEEGNVTVGENACIGNTKADANGNVEVPIQATANYMFVYKAAKED